MFLCFNVSKFCNVGHETSIRTKDYLVRAVDLPPSLTVQFCGVSDLKTSNLKSVREAPYETLNDGRISCPTTSLIQRNVFNNTGLYASGLMFRSIKREKINIHRITRNKLQLKFSWNADDELYKNGEQKLRETILAEVC